tara:strand:- start:51 stop:212 length:162 start_codon:yes stop_codon:yes gene_type:complete
VLEANDNSGAPSPRPATIDLIPLLLGRKWEIEPWMSRVNLFRLTRFQLQYDFA